MKKLVFILIFIFLQKISSDTHIAASASLSDCITAVTAATTGDTVFIIADSATWSSTLTINKGIVLKGAGVDSTKITSSDANPIIMVELPVDTPVRITGIHFDNVSNIDGSSYAIEVKGKKDGSYCISKLQIDNNKFNKGGGEVCINGWINGVIYSNTFINCNRAILVIGDNNTSWGRPIEAGSISSLFIEDNTFIINNDTDREPNQAIYHQEGARTVTRYNTFNSSTYTTGGSYFFDSHGNQTYYSNNPSLDFRGQPIIEVYENVFHVHHLNGNQILEVRGGSNFIWNNDFIYDSGSVPVTIQLWEEEAWSTAHFPVLATNWPAEDQVNNTFIWGNTLKYHDDPSSEITEVPLRFPDEEGEFIQENRDYFMHIPANSGGKETYVDRPGGTMTFSSSGSNAYYPYTPYTYPHPLRGQGDKRCIITIVR